MGEYEIANLFGVFGHSVRTQVKEIYKVGYSNVGYFYKVFRKLCGKSPKTYRLQVMTEHTEDE